MLAALSALRAKSYLNATLHSIDASATGTNKIAICDGYTPTLPAGWRAEPFVRPTALPHNKWAFWHALDLAVTAAEDLILFEDDVRLCVNAARAIEQIKVPADVAFLSFYAPGDTHAEPGIRRSAVHVFLCSQALKIPLRSCRTLVALREQMKTCGAGGGDEAISAISPRGWLFGTYLPGLVQHVGVESVVGNGPLSGMRFSHDYAGDDFDALSIDPALYW